MVKFIIGLVTGILLVFVTIFLLFFAMLRFREKPPQIADNSALVLQLRGDVPEKPPIEYPDFLGQVSTPTVANVWMTLRKAAADPHIKAVVLEPEGLSIGWAKMQEIRGDLEQFKKSGKPLYAYLRTPGAREYYVATPADRIYLGPEDPLYLKGLRAEIMYFKKTLDKLGVTVEVEHAGKYKDFGDMFTRTDMSPETREVTNSLLDNLYGDLVSNIAQGRHKTPDQVKAIIDQGPFQATQALQAGLVDELRFEDQMWGELKSRLKTDDLAQVSLDKYMKVPLSSVGLAGKSRIALIVGEGDIVRGDPTDDGSENELTSYGFDRMLRRAGNDSTIKGVIVRIDSPGGEVTASDEIWRQMNLLRQKKPMVISMSDAAASGGYYIAMNGAPIVAEPGTETGSIGVLFGKPDLHGLYDKLGITKDSLQRGKYADIDSDYTSLTPDERAKLRAGIDESYKGFVTKVAEARHRPFDQIAPVAEGRVWLGSQAKEHNLVDQLGGLDRAVALIKDLAHIPESERVTLVPYPARRNILDVLLKRSQTDMLDAKLRQVFGKTPFHAWMHGGFLRMMPYWVEVK
ncbi:MAG TPA: signal peptide peptidase SppA [Bryobacteraceae bacterium]|nr:signal peptide peptidase SppA [Bryobacteraceae bacterium]